MVSTMPIFQSSTFEYGGEGRYDDVRYLRLNNTPNANAVSAKVAAAEGTEAAVVMASGMAAISTTLLTVLSAGDHILLRRGVYGGTFTLLVHDLERLGIAATVMIVVNLAYLLRRSPSIKFNLGSLQLWMTSHVATGILAFLFAMLHGAMSPGDTERAWKLVSRSAAGAGV